MVKKTSSQDGPYRTFASWTGIGVINGVGRLERHSGGRPENSFALFGQRVFFSLRTLDRFRPVDKAIRITWSTLRARFRASAAPKTRCLCQSFSLERQQLATVFMPVFCPYLAYPAKIWV